MENAAAYKHCGKDRHRDVPSNDFFPKHISQAEQQSQSTDFTNGSQSARGIVAQQQMRGCGQLIEHGSIARLDGRLHDGQRCCPGLCIKIARQLSCHRPGGHLCRKADQQEGTTQQRGVENVTAQTAESHLAHTDGEQRADDDDPDRQVRRQVEAQQQACQDGRTVADGEFLSLQDKLGYRPLEEDAGNNTGGKHNGRADAKIEQRDEQGRYQRDDDTIHVLLH